MCRPPTTDFRRTPKRSITRINRSSDEVANVAEPTLCDTPASSFWGRAFGETFASFCASGARGITRPELNHQGNLGA